MNTFSPSQWPILQESASPIPGDLFVSSPDGNTGIRINKKGNGFVGMLLHNNIWARFDFAVPGFASLAWGATKPDHVPWIIKQVELPATVAPSASLRRLYLLTCEPLPVYLCAFSPSVIEEDDAWSLLDTVPNIMFFALRKTTLVNPKYSDVVARWEVKGVA